MFARPLALFCLIATSVAAAEGPQLVVYLGHSADQPQTPLRHLKRELVSLMAQAGYNVVWRDLKGSREGYSSDLVVAELRGTCSAAGTSPAEAPASPSGSLASSAVQDGKVLPFVKLDCAAVNHLLASSLASEPPARRDYLYGRALGRILAHEFYHVLADTVEHDHHGIAGPSVKPVDLLAERFTFEGPGLAKLRRAPVESTTEEPVSATGR